MKFRDYCSLIAKSVAETGYDLFYPSACVPGFIKEKFYVLDGELTEGGEECVALTWAESLTKGSGAVFLAFRGGGRRVKVLELKGKAILESLVIQVNPYSEDSK